MLGHFVCGKALIMCWKQRYLIDCENNNAFFGKFEQMTQVVTV
jgi:hypothetical protein